MSDTAIWWQAIPPDLAALNAEGAATMAGAVGLEFTSVGPDWIAARIPVEPRTRQPFGRLHGGASVVLAETIGSAGAAFTLDRERFVAVGLEINANHVRPAHQGWVTGTGRPEAIGRTTQVWSIRITDEQDRLVCISRFTAAIIPRERG